MSTSSGAPLRFAAIGLGWVTLNRHIPWLRRTPGAEVVGVVDRDSERVARARRDLRIRLGAVASRVADIDWLSEIDAVTIGTAPMRHYTLARDFLVAGKDVLLEKPLTMTPREAADLVETARANERVLGVVHNFQFASSVRRVHRLLRNGTLGSLRELWAVQLSSPGRRLPTWYEELPLGLFYDESPHFFYLMRHFLGDSVQVSSASILRGANGRNTPASISVQLDGGIAPGRIDMHFETPISEWHLMVVGSQKIAAIDIFRDIAIVLPTDHEHRARDILRTSALSGGQHLMGTVVSGLRHLSGRLSYGNDEVMRRFVRACRLREQPDGVSGLDGAAVVGLQHQVIDHAAPS